MKIDQAFDAITIQLERRIAAIQRELMLLHANPEILYADDTDFRDTKHRLGVAEKYLFQAKAVRAYLKGVSDD